MPIRFVDRSSTIVGRVTASLADVSPNFDGAFTPAPARTGSVLAQLSNFTPGFAGQFQANANRTGVIAATLNNSVATFTGNSSGQTAPGVITTFLMTSAATTGSRPWTLAHAFKQGDVPFGSFITTDAATTQADVRNLWPDLSVKFAVLSGTASFTQGSQKTITVSRTPTAPTGSNVAEPTTLDVVVTLTGAAAGTYTLQSCLGIDRSTWSRGNAGRVRSIAGRVMSEFHYYRPTSDAHLHIWFYVRRYAGGETEVETVIENSWLNVAGPTVKSYSAVVAVSGSTVFSGALTHYHHTRWSRVDWIGTNPQITPQHNVAYIRSTRLVPNYGYGSPTSAAFSGFATAINPTPFALGNFEAAPESPGTQLPIGPLPKWEALYFSSGDSRAYVATVSNCRGAGRTQTHFRDENTGRPARWQDWPSMTLTTGWGPQSAPTASGGGPGGGWQSQGWDTPHAPSVGYSAYLVEGRWPQLETMQIHASFMTLDMSADNRALGSGGVLACISRPPMTTRGAAWTWRQVTQACALSPTLLNGATPATADLAVQQSYASSISNTLDWMHKRFVTGATDGGAHKNSVGWLGQFDQFVGTGNPAHWYGSYWMHDFQVIAWALASDMGLENVSNIALLPIVRNHAYQHIVKRCSVFWPYNRAGVFAGPYLNNTDTAAPQFMTEQQAIAALAATFSMTLDTEAAALPLKQHSSANTNLTSNDTSSMITSYWAFYLMALKLAVDHGYPGALRGFRRIESAPNYGPTTHEDGTGYNNHPIWGNLPRAFSASYTAHTQLQWNNFPGVVKYQNHSARINGVPLGLGGADPILPWSSADTVQGLHIGPNFIPGTWLVHRGGGHGDYAGNNCPAFGPLGHPTMTPDFYNLNPPSVPATSDTALMPDGGPPSAHTYDCIVTDRRRSVVWQLNCPYAWQNGNGQATTSGFDCKVVNPGTPNNEWIFAQDHPRGGAAVAMSFYDYKTDIIYHLPTVLWWQNPPLIGLNCQTRTWVDHGFKGTPGGATFDDYPTCAYDPVTQIACFRGSAGLIAFMDLSNGPTSAHFYTPSLTGASLPTTQSPGILFDPEERAFIIKALPAVRTFYKIAMPATNFREGGSAWTVSIITPSAGTIPDAAETSAAQQQAGSSGGQGWQKKFNYSPPPARGYFGVPSSDALPCIYAKSTVDF